MYNTLILLIYHYYQDAFIMAQFDFLKIQTNILPFSTHSFN